MTVYLPEMRALTHTLHSFTINTACSSSVYATHMACHALRQRDCDAALVGGVNLILTVDQHMNTAKLGILSPTSTCHTFDASADGYGRAEGAGALYLKRLSDAIRDGDPVRGVIRSSAVNTNGKVSGMGITHPSVKGQERVVRQAYERAHLNPKNTAYFECHGTGTPVSNPLSSCSYFPCFCILYLFLPHGELIIMISLAKTYYKKNKLIFGERRLVIQLKFELCPTP